jgi:excisionase family DNA binding protein
VVAVSPQAGPPTRMVEQGVSSAQRLLSAEQVAERWNVPKSQVWRLAREDRVPTVRVGRYVRFRVADLEAWERAGGCGL